MNKNIIIRVFDNGGKTWDRYTVVIYQKSKKLADFVDVYGMSENANSPSGFNQWSGHLSELPAVIEALAGSDDENIGKEVNPITDLPVEVKQGIAMRLA